MNQDSYDPSDAHSRPSNARKDALRDSRNTVGPPTKAPSVGPRIGNSGGRGRRKEAPGLSAAGHETNEPGVLQDVQVVID